MADYLVQEEDGTSRFTLEEGGGFLLLEGTLEASGRGGAIAGANAPTPVAPVGAGGAIAAGNAPTRAVVTTSSGGADAGGVFPNDNLNPPARISQLPVEGLILPDNQTGRISQLPVEVLDASDNQMARVSQLPVEVLDQSDNPSARVSQVAVEVLHRVLYEDIYITVID